MIGLLFCFMLLYRNAKGIGKVVNVLSAITVCAIVYTILGGFFGGYWDAKNLESPPDAFTKGAGRVLMSMAAATRFGVYDMTG